MSDKNNETKSVIHPHNKIGAILPPYETFTINSKTSVSGKNYPTSLGVVGDTVVTKKRMSDKSIPFNYLLNCPSANAVRQVIAFNDENGDPCKTIVLFDNGDRVVVKRSENDKPDLKQSILWAIVKHSFGTSLERQLDKIVKNVTFDSKTYSIISKSAVKKEMPQICD